MLIFGLAVYLSLAGPYFLQWQNILNITFSISVIGTAAAFATLVVISGGIDLTPITITIVVGIVCGRALDAGVPFTATVVIALLASIAIGLINGGLIALLRLNPFIVTLGTNFLFTGIAFVVTAGNALEITNGSFLQIGQSLLPFQIPTPTVIMLVCFALGFFILRFTLLGSHIYAIGGDEAAARLSGVRVSRIKIVVYVLSALAAGVAGVVQASATGSVAAFAGAGSNDLLAILAAVIIGGTALVGGRGSVIGTLGGVLLIGLIANGLVLENISPFYQPVVTGAILLTAIILDEVRRRVSPIDL
jgi:ribose transport system permease protein